MNTPDPKPEEPGHDPAPFTDPDGTTEADSDEEQQEDGSDESETG
jgi:hypothetical protein